MPRTTTPYSIRPKRLTSCGFLLAVGSLVFSLPAIGQTRTNRGGLPRVVIPTSNRPTTPVRPVNRANGILYPWRQNIVATVFWIGEDPSQNNPTPNYKSSWDQNWTANFGGYDDPSPSARIADHTTGDFRPKKFIPKLNPFYIALPYNDVAGWSRHKPEASKVIPWFSRMDPKPGKTVLKGRWVQIYNGKRSCYAQWEDCGPWETDNWEYVFKGQRPRNKSNKGAAIDISPSVRDYLDLQSGQKCHWRFVEAAQVPYGPWKKYGAQNASPSGQAPPTQGGQDPEAQRRYLEYLRKLRDEQYLKKSKSELENSR